MKIKQEDLKRALVEPGHISEKEWGGVEKEAKAGGSDIQALLIRKGLISEKNLAKLVADMLDVKFLDLSVQEIDDKIFNEIPEMVARTREVIAVQQKKDKVIVGMTDPTNLETVHLLEKRFGQDVDPYLITETDFKEALIRYASELQEDLQGLIQEFDAKELDETERDALTVKIVDQMIIYGIDNKASDIHIEPFEKKLLIRYRIDGVLHDAFTAPKKLEDFLVTRIKILGKMRTDEHMAAQDGKVRFRSGDKKVDLRVSILPVTRGEKVVMRLLAAQRELTLSDLGLQDHDYEKVRAAIEHPHGMILVTGPTGSGKTTTLYSVLRILNKREVNITTIEDPVEYDIEGVNQIQVNTRTDLTFAKGLRSIVRQDPDIIMVGEIRDKETAGIATNAALTGHLVLSTLHTNNAAATIPRLIDMKVEPFLVASTVNVILAQRLVRTICSHCRLSHKLTKKEMDGLEDEVKDKITAKISKKESLKSYTFYKGKGCPVCNQTGYQGRVGIFEVLEVSDPVRELIMKEASSNEIEDLAKKEGMTTMLDDGISKVIQGITTLEEVLRVTRE